MRTKRKLRITKNNMKVTIFSFLSTLLWCNVLIAAIYLLRHTRLKHRFGVPTIALLYLFCVVRFFLPLEFPHARIISDSVVYPQIYNLLMEKRDILVKASPVSFLCAAWFIGFCILLLRYVRQYRRAVRSVVQYAKPWNARTHALMKEVQQRSQRAIKVQGYTASQIESAYSIGILHKRIILPDNRCTEQELRYILLHEYTHFLHHDTVVKALVTLFCMIFWWNPVVYLLQKDLEQTLEIKCDLAVARTLNHRERADYLRTIISLMKRSKNRAHLPFCTAALFQADAQKAIKERFHAVTSYAVPQSHRTVDIVLTGIFAALLIASYTILPQPEFDAPRSEKSGVIEFDSDTAYILQDEAQEYWLYIQDEAPIKLTKDAAAFYQQTGLTITKE